MSDTDVNGAAAAAAPASEDSPSVQGKQSAVKDKNCPFCGQAFTSSSLGRHLDLYVKDKNPKPPDGIHDVDAIRKMRSGITRRQPRGSLARRDSSNHLGSTPPASARKPSPSREGHGSAMPTSTDRQDRQLVVDNQPIRLSWESTGVILDIPDPAASSERPMQVDDDTSQGSTASRRVSQSHNQSRNGTSRAAQKAQLDARHKLTDAMDTARAAELALRELLSSLRAAKQHFDMYSQPFDFDPLSLDFPALTLQCLNAPPTLFSSTPHPTSTSWSIEPPSAKQHEALRVHFQEQFQKWKATCATATTALAEDFTYPMPQTLATQDLKETVKEAEAAAVILEKQVSEHLQSTYQAWESLVPERKKELWILEMARGIGRRQNEVDSLKQQRHGLKQESANLKSQIEHLNRLQQPREFRIVPPTTIPIDESILSYLLGNAASLARKTFGLNIDHRHLDLNDLVSMAIERWKSAIVSTRAQGMAGQKPLDLATSIPTPTSATAPTLARLGQTQPSKAPSHMSAAKASQRHVQQPRQCQKQQHQQERPLSETDTVTNFSNGEQIEANPSAAGSPAPEPTHAPHQIEDDHGNDDSDEDADAEMDEDEPFQQLGSTEPLVVQQQQTEVSDSKALPRDTSSTNASHFMVNGSSGADVHVMSTQQAEIADMSSTATLQQQSQQALYNNFGVADGADSDAMYMD